MYKRQVDQKLRDQITNCATGAIAGGTAGAFIPLLNTVAVPIGAIGGCLAGLGVVEATHFLDIHNPKLTNCITGATTGGIVGALIPFLGPVAIPAGAIGGCLTGLGVVGADGAIDRMIEHGNEKIKPLSNLIPEAPPLRAEFETTRQKAKS